MAFSKSDPNERLTRKRMNARLRQQRCRARKKAIQLLDTKSQHELRGTSLKRNFDHKQQSFHNYIPQNSSKQYIPARWIVNCNQQISSDDKVSSQCGHPAQSTLISLSPQYDCPAQSNSSSHCGHSVQNSVLPLSSLSCGTQQNKDIMHRRDFFGSDESQKLSSSSYEKTNHSGEDMLRKAAIDAMLSLRTTDDLAIRKRMNPTVIIAKSSMKGQAFFCSRKDEKVLQSSRNIQSKQKMPDEKHQNNNLGSCMYVYINNRASQSYRNHAESISPRRHFIPLSRERE